MMRTVLTSTIVLMLAGVAAAPAQSQSARGGAIEGRVDRLEGEMRAVQRKVFPGGTGQYVQPDNAPVALETMPPGTPASSPVADLTARVDSLETQLRGLTGQVETNQHRLQLLEERIKTLESEAASAPAPQPALGDRPTALDRAPVKPTVDTPVAAKAAVKPATAADTGPAVNGDPARGAKLAAVEKPETGDVAEDAYLYGYRLWAAKLYPEAEAQFTTVTTKFATHKRASYAQNLLGRSYLEDGKPSLASLAFYDNYKKWPDGDRAPESLYYLAQALVKLDKPAAQVCKVYTELARSYGAKVDADPKMKAGVAKGRAASKCS